MRFRINSVFSLYSSNKPSSKHQRHQKTINTPKKPPQVHKQQPNAEENQPKTRRNHPNKSPNDPDPPPPNTDPWLTLRTDAQRTQLQQVKTETAENHLHPNPGQRRNQHPPAMKHALNDSKHPLHGPSLQPDPPVP